MKIIIETTRKQAAEMLGCLNDSVTVEFLTNKQEKGWMGGYGSKVSDVKKEVEVLISQREDEKVGLLFDNCFVIACVNEIHQKRGGGQKCWSYPVDRLEYAKKHYNRLLSEPYLYTNIQTNF